MSENKYVALKKWQFYLMVGLIVILLGAYMGYIDLSKIPGLSILQKKEGEGGGIPSSELVIVNRPIKFTVRDKWAGTAVASATVKVYQGTQLLETLTTDSNGQATTGQSYQSGTALNILVTKSNSKAWYSITVPKMSKADVESQASNPVTLEFFTICTLTDSLMDTAGNSYADGANYNKTSASLGNTPSFTYNLYTSNDNTGFIESYDPINNINWWIVVYVKISGTNYENVLISGLDGVYGKGTSTYAYKHIEATEVTKYKVGNTYVYDGSTSVSFSLDLTGYSGDSAVVQIYVYAYSDPAYHEEKGSFGPDAVQLAEHTLNLVD